MNRFSVNILLRIILLTLSTITSVWVWTALGAFPGVAMGILITMQIYGMYYYINRVNRKLTLFLESIRYEDFSIRFSADNKLGKSFQALNHQFNEVLEACLKATNELWAEISGKNADFKKSIDAMQAYRSDQYLWWQVAEYTYDSFMIRSRTRG